MGLINVLLTIVLLQLKSFIIRNDIINPCNRIILNMVNILELFSYLIKHGKRINFL